MYTVKLDTRTILKDIANQQKQHISALSSAINETQGQRQTAARKHILSKLNIRTATARKLFADAVRFAKEDRADMRTGKFSATVRIVGGDLKASTDLFRRFGAMIIRQDEVGTQSSDALYRTQNRQFTVGGFVMPAEGLRGAKGVPRSLYPAMIGLSARSLRYDDSDDAQRQYKGRKKKRGVGFIKDTRYHFVKENVGIFVRRQVGKESEYDSIWFFRKTFKLPNRLDLAGTFTQGLEQQFAANYSAALESANRKAT